MKSILHHFGFARIEDCAAVADAVAQQAEESMASWKEWSSKERAGRNSAEMVEQYEEAFRVQREIRQRALVTAEYIRRFNPRYRQAEIPSSKVPSAIYG